MTLLIKQLIKRTPLYPLLLKWRGRRRRKQLIIDWRKKGCPFPPPPIVKHSILKQYARRYRLRTMVETGTCMGDTVEAMRQVMDRIYSIELGRELHDLATNRFRQYPEIELILGDSGREIGRLLKELDRPALFWLDGHYSGNGTAQGDKDTPIREELSSILDASDMGHVILIDDARLFGADPAYPALEDLRSAVLARRPEARFLVQDDIIRITPG